MDKFTASGTDNVLTLAFEKAATQETKVFHPWRYFVAGGETLAKIERFLDENDATPVLVPIEELIDEARNGRMFILVDD